MSTEAQSAHTAPKNLETNINQNAPIPSYSYQPLLAVPTVIPFGFQPSPPPIPQNSTLDHEIIELDRKEIREIRLKRRQQLQKAHQDKLAELEREEIQLQIEENTRRLQRLEAAESKRLREYHAAVVLQKHSRRRLVRNKIPDLKVNEITKYKTPEKYILEMLILEIVRDEFVAEVLVEIAEGEYFPYSKSKEFRLLRIQYHIIEETLCELTRMTIRDFLCDFAREQIDSHPKKDPIDELIDELMDETSREITREIVQALFNDMVETHLRLSKSEALFDKILAELIVEMEIAPEAFDELIQESIMDEIIMDVIQEFIYGACKDMEIGVIIWKSESTPPKSTFIDFCMERSFDRMVTALLLQIVASNGASFFSADMLEKLMDKHIIELLLSEFTSLEIYRDNTTRDFAIPPESESSHVPPAVEETFIIADGLN